MLYLGALILCSSISENEPRMFPEENLKPAYSIPEFPQPTPVPVYSDLCLGLTPEFP